MAPWELRRGHPRLRMLDGFDEGWIDFEGGDAVETCHGDTPLETVLRSLPDRDGAR